MAERMVIKDRHKFWHYLKNRRHHHVKSYQPRFIFMFLFIGIMIGGIAYGLPHLSEIDFEFDNESPASANSGRQNSPSSAQNNWQPINDKINPSSQEKSSKETKKEITHENIHIYLSEDELVKALPKSAIIKLSIGEITYTVKKESVKKGAPSSQDYDLEIAISNEYIQQLAQNGICETFGEALHKEEASVNPLISQPELIWKYKSMYDYKSCLGI